MIPRTGFIVMWRPVYAKRVHGIGLGGMHSTYRMPTDTSTLSDSDTKRSAGFESELSKRQHKAAHEREIRKAIRHKLLKKKREHTDNMHTAAVVAAAAARFSSNKRHHRGAGHPVCKKKKTMNKFPMNCTDHSDDGENEFDDDDDDDDDESDTTTGSETDDTDSGSILSDDSATYVDDGQDEQDDDDDDNDDMSIILNAESQLENDETDNELADETDDGEEDLQDVLNDEKEDRILAAEEAAWRKLNSKSSKLGGGGGKNKGFKKQTRRCELVKKTSDSAAHLTSHRGCGLVVTPPDEENPVGEGRYRRRRRRRCRRRYRRRQNPLKGTYRRYRRRRRRRRYY